MTDINQQFSEKVLKLIKETVETIILPAHYDLDPETIMTKDDHSIVTLTDQHAEKILTKGLKEIFAANVLGEEGYDADPEIADYLEQNEYCWIIDPIDGTKNFAHGRPEFGVIVALVKNKEVLAGWIYHCTEKRAVYAIKGLGVYDELHQVVSRPTLKDQFTGYHNPFYFVSSSVETEINAIGAARTKDIPAPRASSIEYLNLVAGVSDFMINNHCKPWDHAAGQLIVAELGLGGCGEFLSGEPYAINKSAWVSAERNRVLMTGATRSVRDRLKAYFK